MMLKKKKRKRNGRRTTEKCAIEYYYGWQIKRKEIRIYFPHRNRVHLNVEKLHLSEWKLATTKRSLFHSTCRKQIKPLFGRSIQMMLSSQHQLCRIISNVKLCTWTHTQTLTMYSLTRSVGRSVGQLTHFNAHSKVASTVINQTSIS